MLKVSTKDVERFLSKLCVQDDHWIFIGDSQQKKYAQINIKGKMIGVHRFAFQLWNGRIPKNYHVDHECGVPRCCNPEHLRARTSADNNRLKFGWFELDGAWFCSKGHKQVGYNVYTKSSDGFSKCRECMNTYFRNRNRALNKG